MQAARDIQPRAVRRGPDAMSETAALSLPPIRPVRHTAALGAVLALALASCGGGGDGGSAPTAPPAGPAGPTMADRMAAANATAIGTSNACAPIRPFYWEIGDATGALASGSVASSTLATVYTATTTMAIASASKWLYSGYVVEKQAGVLSDSDIKYLNFRSGYTNFSLCSRDQTVQQCVDAGSNGVYSAANDGKFVYGGGHMEKHASLIGLGPLANAALAAEIRSQIGTDVGLAYSQPQLAGGAVSSAAEYARYLRKLLAGNLRMGSLLGSHAVCTNPLTCTTAGGTPVPSSESWHYSIGHWVEDDPVVGDGAFSSAGSFGFYPWIDAGKTIYGVLARSEGAGSGFDSVDCGRLVRKAWVTAVAR